MTDGTTFWMERYYAVVNEKKALGDKLRETLEENESLHNVVDRFVDKCKELEDKAEGYENALKDMKERLDKSIADRSELQADRDIWFRKNGEKQAEIEELKKDLDDAKKQLEYFTHSRDEWRGRAKHAEKQLEENKQEINQRYVEGYSDGNEEGQNELWEMLQLINDVKPFEAPYFEDVTSMNDIISWDLEDFKDAYSKWEEEKKNVEYMRSYLKRYCLGRLCVNCALHDAAKPVSSCMFSTLTDEEVEERYRKAVDSEYKKTRIPVSARLPQPWECTIEAKVEINKDLLEKVCGVKPNEEAHKLEYGDAVRVPWRDYDYMYIGPDKRGDGKMVRLFDPKHHSIAYISSNGHLDIRGYKIIIGNEEDLRKIWYDKDTDK